MNAIIKSYLRVGQELHMYRHNTSADLCQMKNLRKKSKLNKCKGNQCLFNVYKSDYI